MEVTNPFTNSEDAKRYQAYRPNYHHIPFALVKDFLGAPVKRSLDVACGTGHSTTALKNISEETIGCDGSLAMITEARSRSNTQYVQAVAEALPFAADSFDLLNISMAIHWVKQKQFLTEAHRVLKPDGYLIVDNYGFTGTAPDVENFRQVHAEFYKTHLPRASRSSNYPEDALLFETGFRLVHEFQYEHQVSMNLETYAQFIMTQSNYLILAEEKKTQLPQLIQTSYGPLFKNQILNLNFAGILKLYRKTPGTEARD